MINKVIRKRQPKKPKVYAFIDNQNLNLGVQRMGWKMDWRKFQQFLADEYGVEKTFMFIGYMQEHEDLYTQMHDAGYYVILKPTVGMFMDHSDEENTVPMKGNTDAELVLHAMIEYKNYDKAIIISGDGDFHCIIEYLEKNNKLMHVMTPNWKYSSLLNEFEKYIVRIDKLRGKLAYRDRRRPRDSKKTVKKKD